MSSTLHKSTWTVHPSQSQLDSPLGIDTITFNPVPLTSQGERNGNQGHQTSVPQPPPAISTSEKQIQSPIHPSPPHTPVQQPVPEIQPRQKHTHTTTTTTTTTTSTCSNPQESLQAIVAWEAESSSAISNKDPTVRSDAHATSSSGTQPPCAAKGAASATAASLPHPPKAVSSASTSHLSQTAPSASAPASSHARLQTDTACSTTAITLTATDSTGTLPPVTIHEEVSELTPKEPSLLATNRSEEQQQQQQQQRQRQPVLESCDQEPTTPLVARSRLSIPSSIFSNLSLPKINRSTSSAATSIVSFASRPRSQSSATSASTSLKDDDSRRNSSVSVLSLGHCNSSSNLVTAASTLQSANATSPTSPVAPSSGSSGHYHPRSHSPPPPPQRASRILFQAAASSSSVTASTSSPVSSTVSFSSPLSPTLNPHPLSQPSSSTTDPLPSSSSKPFLKRMIKLTRNKSVPVPGSSISSPKTLPMRKTSTNVFSSFPSLSLTRTTSDSWSIFSSTTSATTTSPKAKSHSRSSSKSRSRSGSTAAQDQAVVNKIISAIQRGSFITLSDMDLDVLIQALQGKNSRVLEALNISAASISASDAKVLARLIRSSEAANIKSLRMNSSTISQQASKLMFEAWKFNRTITTLRLSRSGVDDKTVKYLSRMLAKNETLAALDLSNNSITPAGMELLAEALLVNRSITRLSLQSNNIRRAGAPHLAKVLTRNRVLKHLNIGSNGLGPDGSTVIADAVRFNRTLISLALDMNELGVKGAQALGVALGSNRHLTHLFIPHNNIGDEGVAYICEALKRNRTLTVLDLELNNIGQGRNVLGLMRLADVLKVNTTLRELNLAFNLVSTEAVQELSAGLMENSSLESIVLTNCCLTEDSAKALAKVLVSPKTGLQNLSLSSNPEIGVDGYWALATAMVKNRSLKGIQLDYNSDDRQQLYDSIQNSLTRNHIWQQAIYSAACRILSLSRIVLLGRPGISREQYFGVDSSQLPLNGSMQRSTSMTSKQGSSSWGGKILRRMVGRTNSSNSLASMLSMARRDPHGSSHGHAIEGGGAGHPADGQQQDVHHPHHNYHHHQIGGNGSVGGGHTRKQSVSSVATSMLGSTHGTIRSTAGTISMSSSQLPPSHLATLSPPLASEALSVQQQQQQQQASSSMSYQLPPEYHYHRILPNLGDMPCEIFENICAFLDPGRCMTIAQVRATVREANDRSTLRTSMTKDKMLERIFKSRYISPMGTRYNSGPEEI